MTEECVSIRWYACALVVALSTGCKVEHHQVVVDSGQAGLGAATLVDSLHGLGIAADSVNAVDTAASSPSLPSSSRTTDTTSVLASSDELQELAGTLLIPVQGVRAGDLHDTFDERRDGGSRPHEALDILAPRGTPVLAATDGPLLKLFSSVAGGLMIYQADATDRFILMYGHLDRYADGLRNGQALRHGQVIGYVGTTGDAAGGPSHLHFAIARGHPSAAWWRGTPVNPYPLLRNGMTIQP